MLKQIGRFKADSANVIHIKSKEDEIEFFNEVDHLSKNSLSDLPLVVYDYEDKTNIYLVGRKQ